MQDQLFYTFLSGDSPACASPWVHYKTRPHLLNRKSLHCGFSVSAKGHHIVISFFAKCFSRQATGQQGFPGHAIITD